MMMVQLSSSPTIRQSIAKNWKILINKLFEMILTEKLCPICKCVKSIESFYFYFSKIRNKTRVSNYCKLCARVKGNERAKAHYQKNKEKKKQYAKEYRRENADKVKILRSKFRKKYRDDLQNCYVRDYLVYSNNIPLKMLDEFPEIVETKRLQLKIIRKIKLLKNGKK